MNPLSDAILRSWPTAPWLAAALFATSAVYVRGWLHLHRRDPRRWHAARLVAFLSGLAAFYLALASPIEEFASLLLAVHMVQHLLLMMIAPPLMWLGWPLLPLLRGLPDPVRAVWVAPLLQWQPLRRSCSRLVHPLVAWPFFVAMTWLWHTPRGYELGLASDSWHIAEHACFVVAAMIFWYPVVRPFPSRPRWPQWLLFPYLILADVQNTLLAAWLTFAPRVLYPHYLQVPRLGGLTALDDQRLAGVLMWVPGSIAFLLPLFWIAVRYLYIGDPKQHAARISGTATGHCGRHREKRHHRTPPPRPRTADVLTLPLVGGFLRWRYARRAAQFALAILAAIIIYDGFRGPQVAPMNLAGVLPWIHWRGLVVLAMLIAGNVFCFACPFTLPRALARRWLPAGRAWPRWLRSKWLAVALVATFLWSYEAFALWDSPWITAWIAIGYFVAALVVDGVFSGAAFCKYVCPIGQFNFVQSLMSPLEVTVRQPAVCASCSTRDCLHGRGTIPGCEMHLFQPRKAGNLDCTFCLDCLHACPHGNVGVLAVMPGRTLWTDRLRSGLGRLSRRADVAALVVVLTFGAFANAAGMIAPVVLWQDRVRAALGDPVPLVVITAFYALAIAVVPATTVTVAAMISRRHTGNKSLVDTATRFSFALVPLGFAMWLAHYSFHFFTSWDSVIPATQRFAADAGFAGLGAPQWQSACCRPAAAWITQLQVQMLNVGLLGSLYAAFRIAESPDTSLRQAAAAVAPWTILISLLFLFGVWIVFQPMEMRGTLQLSTYQKARP